MTNKGKTLRPWSKKEDKILLKHFHDKPFSAHDGTRFIYLARKLVKSGVWKGWERTPKAISRRTYRLGLLSYQVDPTIKVKVKCSVCNTMHERLKKHVRKPFVCEACKKKQPYNGYKDIEQYRAYRRAYMKHYRSM